MAFLYLKSKLFPQRALQDTTAYSPVGWGRFHPSVLSPAIVLLVTNHDHHLGKGNDGDRDVESQLSPSYDTFRQPAEGEPFVSPNSPRSDATSSSGNSSRSSSRIIKPRVVSDSILGLSDGLTVPFALSAGLSALGDTKVVVLGGLAELTAGAISMGLGGYVGAKSEAYVARTHFPRLPD